MECHGNGPDHCCSLGEYGVCVFLEEGTVPGRRWACRLRRELGSWKRVHADDQYKKVRSMLRDIGVKVDCGDWPQNVPGLLARVNSTTADRVNPSAVCCWGDDG